MDVQKAQPETPETLSSSRVQAFRRSPGVSALILIGFLVSLLLVGVAYLLFIKPDTGPASALFLKLFPPQSGLIQLQTIRLDFDSVLNNSVFLQLKDKGAPIEMPPLGKPNPFL